MSNRNWYDHPGGWGGQPPGQGKDSDNRGARQRWSFDDDDYDFLDDGDYRRRAPNEQDYETRRRAIFQVQGDREPNSPLLQRTGGGSSSPPASLSGQCGGRGWGSHNGH